MLSDDELQVKDWVIRAIMTQGYNAAWDTINNNDANMTDSERELAFEWYSTFPKEVLISERI